MSRKRLLFRLGYFYLSLIGFFGHILPRWLMFRMAVLIGNFYWLVMKRDRQAVRTNLSCIVRPAELASTVRKTYVRYAKYLVDYTRMDMLTEKHLRRIVHGFEGKEHIDRALDRGRGALILTGHLGNWEMGGAFLSLMGFSLTVITAPDVEARLHDYRVRLREEKRIKVITLDDTLASAVTILKCLKDNELVALLGDRELFGKGIPVNFFGRSVFFPMGPPLLAYLSEAALIPTVVLLGRDDRYSCIAEPPIPIQNTGRRDEDLKVNTQRIAGVMEKFVGRYPDQWFTFYDYFTRHRA
ncbi:MAG TPA: lysophospholipid acyltransferase family protein [Thermodesulfobacteriota bacterium]|nr:lysophospholipid acyltransferase family protein [Thermodesulfobacteriota bacterium]